MSCHIYRATRGKYDKPIPIAESGLKFVNEDGDILSPPIKHSCGHSKHWEWGKGTRNGQKLYFPITEMFVQFWKLTKKEMKVALNQYDMASLEMPTIIICKDCAEKETSQINPQSQLNKETK